MRRLQQPKVFYNDGSQVVLNAKELDTANFWQRQVNDRFRNSLGYEVSITTLTTICKKISEQKFFEVPPAQYVPIVIGQGTWSSNYNIYRSFDIVDQFETGFINVGGANARLANADTGVDALNIKQYNWAKAIGWNIFELEEAAKAGNWDLVAAKEESRKRNWDLGVQRIAFLGAQGFNGSSGTMQGLLNQPGASVNTTVITKLISSMSVSELKTFTGTVLEAYRSNVNRTAYPTHFVIPESDWNGLASQASPDFPIKSTLELLEDTFKTITMNKDFKILPLAYADPAYNSQFLPSTSINYNKHIYSLYRYDEKSLVMNVGLDYTNTLANSLDNFNFQNCGYGQLTGLLLLRPLELLYFTF